MNGGTTYSIGICVKYDDEVYTLSAVTFKRNLDIVIWQPTRDCGKAGKRKWDPHVTYHGANGICWPVAYNWPVKRRFKKQLQVIDSAFSGLESLSRQAFDRDLARRLGQRCMGFDTSMVIESRDIRNTVDKVEDQLGKVETPLPTAWFQVDLIEPDKLDLVASVVTNAARMIKQELIKTTFPWCLLTVCSTES